MPLERVAKGEDRIMFLRNTESNYGAVTIVIHWLMALLIIGLFALGLYMTGLDYYHPWYKKGPDLHRSLGVLMLLMLLLRLLWRSLNPIPRPLGRDPAWMHRVAAAVHGALYLLLLAIAVSGYLISTADGRGIPVFDLFILPAMLPPVEQMADRAGLVHQWLAYILMGLVALHALAALKHHFIDHDATLMRMLGRPAAMDGRFDIDTNTSKEMT